MVGPLSATPSQLVAAAAALAVRHGLTARPLPGATVREIDLRAGDPFAGPPPNAAADYLLVRGPCSRLDARGRAELFAHVAVSLAPDGLALIECDALPGALDLAPLRALMRFHVVRVPEPASAIAQARAIARWHLERVRRLVGDDGVGVLERVVVEVETMTDDALLRLLRDPIWEPLALVDLAAELERHGLRWRADLAVLDDGGPLGAPPPAPPVGLADHGDDPIVERQYLDYFRMARWRQSLATLIPGG